MVNKREAVNLSKRIVMDLPQMKVTGLRHYEDGGYAIDAQDTKTGYLMVIHSAEEWEEHLRAAKFPWGDVESEA